MLEVTDLQKKFGKRQALKDVSFSLAAGEIYGLLGPNGAGKTTTLKILAGLLAPDGGRVIVDGQPYHREHHELKRRIAYVPDQPFLYYKLSGEEHLNFYMDLYKIPYARRREKIDFFFKYFEFEEYRTRAGRELLGRHAPEAAHLAGAGRRARACCCSTSRWSPSTRWWGENSSST